MVKELGVKPNPDDMTNDVVCHVWMKYARLAYYRKQKLGLSSYSTSSSSYNTTGSLLTVAYKQGSTQRI